MFNDRQRFCTITGSVTVAFKASKPTLVTMYVHATTGSGMIEVTPIPANGSDVHVAIASWNAKGGVPYASLCVPVLKGETFSVLMNTFNGSAKAIGFATFDASSDDRSPPLTEVELTAAGNVRSPRT